MRLEGSLHIDLTSTGSSRAGKATMGGKERSQRDRQSGVNEITWKRTGHARKRDAPPNPRPPYRTSSIYHSLKNNNLSNTPIYSQSCLQDKEVRPERYTTRPLLHMLTPQQKQPEQTPSTTRSPKRPQKARTMTKTRPLS